MKKNIGIVKYPGSNCDEDTFRYFSNHNVFFIWHKETKAPVNIDLLIIPGGFAYGDRFYEKATEDYMIAPGKMAALSNVTNIILELHKRNVPIIGFCNGFQVLIQLSLLPGKLERNNNNRFCCKKVDCSIYNNSGVSTDFTLDIANQYGRYIEPTKSLKSNPLKSSQVLLTYKTYNNGSSKFKDMCIGGICNEARNVFGMMPHPERSNNDELRDFLLNIAERNLSDHFEYKITRLMNSEHISYKSTRSYLRTLHTKENWVVQGPGENAGIVELGIDNYCLALRMESHNHPTYIDPYNGASTGVGGIIRDIIAMGAKPIALLDFLRFGTNDNGRILFENATQGIADYGNTIGIPNVGGDTYFHSCYDKNPLVNVACLGLVKKDNIIYGNALNEKSFLIYIGAKTGKEGVDGAFMASQSFGNSVEHLKENVQVGDPFLERLLLEACCELADMKIIEGMQDMGAGGILCASLELIKRGRVKTKKNLGCQINLDDIPVKYNMDLCEKLISESQERMLLVCNATNKDKVNAVLSKWDLESVVIGVVDLSGKYNVYNDNVKIYEKPIDMFVEPEQHWKIIPRKQHEDDEYQPVKMKETIEKETWSIYDNTIGGRVVKGPLEKEHYSILHIREINKNIVITWGKHFLTCYNTMIKVSSKAVKPLCMINCLNYGHPKYHMFDIDIMIKDLNYYCSMYHIPIVGGNVSLYNNTEEKSIRPTPVFVMVGIMTDY